MDTAKLERITATAWRIPPHDGMHVPGIVYADEYLIADMDDKVCQQVCNVAKLPGIVEASYAMPDAHWGYGFPIGGVAAFDPEAGGVVSAGGVGFDISCGVRTMLTGLPANRVVEVRDTLADALYAEIPVGLGSTGHLHVVGEEMDAMLLGGARWAVEQGYGDAADLERIEERGRMAGAEPATVSDRAKTRQRDEVGTLGSGNHYLEVQQVAEILLPDVAEVFGLREGDAVVTIHCGSRGLGHQIGTEFLREMVETAGEHGIALPDRELACAPIESALGRRYLGAMRAGINCAFANREVIGHLARQVFARVLPEARLDLLFDVSHNTCKEEAHPVAGESAARRLFVHRKGATRAFGAGDPALPEPLRAVGQPVLIGGSMGTASYVLVGTPRDGGHAFRSACHGAGRALSRHAALRRWRGRDIVNDLEQRGIAIRSPSMRGVAEEAPGAYKDIDAVVEVAERAGLARRVARLTPMICVKG
ncbi:RtcB family protein [Ferruginivarius sediminum]|uniref:tRNA-splicing ligase RtcB n=1 Tax=Ferruginivarius sediminum TaxID=2661937 RepID=A0A369TDQ1_9PROT|nr:RtcB family protein [Ferruginivarius sediminum]RDD61046.1 RtcB family protein [Ferruginivarius sediminum]